MRETDRSEWRHRPRTISKFQRKHRETAEEHCCQVGGEVWPREKRPPSVISNDQSVAFIANSAPAEGVDRGKKGGCRGVEKEVWGGEEVVAWGKRMEGILHAKLKSIGILCKMKGLFPYRQARGFGTQVASNEKGKDGGKEGVGKRRQMT